MALQRQRAKAKADRVNTAVSQITPPPRPHPQCLEPVIVMLPGKGDSTDTRKSTDHEARGVSECLKQRTSLWLPFRLVSCLLRQHCPPGFSKIWKAMFQTQGSPALGWELSFSLSNEHHVVSPKGKLHCFSKRSHLALLALSPSVHLGRVY